MTFPDYSSAAFGKSNYSSAAFGKSKQSGGIFSAFKTAISANPVGFGIKAANSIMSGFGEYNAMKLQIDQQNQSIDHSNAMSVQQRALDNQRIAATNRHARETRAAEERISKKQVAFNNESANRAWIDTGFQEFEQMQQSRFQKQRMQVELMRAQGSNAAANEGNRGRTFDIAAAKDTSGAFGRQMGEMREKGKAQGRAINSKYANIDLQRKGANLRATAPLELPVYQQQQLPPALQQSRISMPKNSGLMIGVKQALGGLSSFFG